MGKIQPAVRKETLRIAVGTSLMTVCMLLVFWALGRFNLTVLWGALLGTAAAIGNFFLLAYGVQKAAERMNGVKLPSFDEAERELPEGEELPAPDCPEIKQAKSRIQLSYTGRMVLLAVIGIIGLTVPCFHAVATVLPFLFPRMVIFLSGFRKQKEAA